MNTFEKQDYSTLIAHEHNEKYLNNDTALLCFFIQGKSVYKDVHGKYYYSSLIDDSQSEFVYFEDLALVKELSPADDELLPLIKTLEDKNSLISGTGLNLIEIRYIDAPTFVMYNADMQIFIETDLEGFDVINESLISQLSKLAPRPNTFDKPIFVSLDTNGQIIKCDNLISSEVH